LFFLTANTLSFFSFYKTTKLNNEEKMRQLNWLTTYFIALKNFKLSFKPTFLLIAAVISLLIQNVAFALDQFWDFGFDQWSGISHAYQISRDGSTVVGQSYGSAGIPRGIIWRPGLPSALQIDAPPGMLVPPGFTRAVSIDGQKFLSFAYPTSTSNISYRQAYIAEGVDNQTWTLPTTFNPLPFAGESSFTTMAFLSADAQFALGTYFNGETRIVSTAPNSSYNFNFGVLANGSTYKLLAASDNLQVFGGVYYPTNNPKGFIFANGQFSPLSSLHATLSLASEVTSISPDGQIIVGNARINSLGYRPFVLNRQTGLLKWLNTSNNPQLDIYAKSLAANAQVIVGTVVPKSSFAAVFGPPRAFRWVCDTASGNIVRQDIQKVLLQTTNNNDLPYWRLHDAVSVSGDGRMIIGNGQSPVSGQNFGQVQPWYAVVELPNLGNGPGCF
jgi:uncharacterized membrane protein